ncbi:MAG: DUF420 domain-containing protein [Acidobacteriales bacterium]|nr:DUF420 domain-containing protein [Terriglobales bacterium]
MPAPTSVLPSVNATLNGVSALLLAIGRWQIYRGRVERHRAVMLTAFATSGAFLVCYLWYHAHVGSVRFQHHGPLRNFYLLLLGTHTILAMLLVPLVLVTLSRALRSRFTLHKRIARWTWPVWMYVSVTGVIVYWMLYHLDR